MSRAYRIFRVVEDTQEALTERLALAKTAVEELHSELQVYTRERGGRDDYWFGNVTVSKPASSRKTRWSTIHNAVMQSSSHMVRTYRFK